MEKVRIRNTARAILQKPSGNADKTGKITTKDKICLDYNANGCKFMSDHIIYGQIVKHACSHCFKEVGKFYYHKVQDCIRRRGSEATKDNAKIRFQINSNRILNRKKAYNMGEFGQQKDCTAVTDCSECEKSSFSELSSCDDSVNLNFSSISDYREKFCTEVYEKMSGGALNTSVQHMSHNNSLVNWNINKTLLNVGYSESMFLVHLFSCNDKEALWCFVHGSVNRKTYCVNRSKDFGFVCDIYPLLPLFRTGRELECVDQIQWAFQTHSIVAESHCPNYKVHM